MTQLPAASPESAGIPSAAVTGLLEELERRRVPMHAFLLARRGRLVSEAYYAPYGPERLHRMFSVSKSFVSLAVGLLEQDGLISLDDGIAGYFPEKLPEKVHPWVRSMTIRDMLKMQTCHSGTTYKLHPERDWVESFFTTPPSHPPGRVFLYDTSSAHTLCALAEKLTGKPLLDYLREKCLNEIGFSEDAYFLRDPFGVSMGGSGLMARPADIMKLGLLLLNRGKTAEGKPLLPESYLRQACAFQTSTVHTASFAEESFGYGYQFWRTRHGGFACYGMGGQLAVILPEQDLVCVTAADTQGMQGGTQAIYDALYAHILPVLCDFPLPEDRDSLRALRKKERGLSLPRVPGEAWSPTAASVSGVVYRIRGAEVPFESFFLDLPAGRRKGTLSFDVRAKRHTLSFGFGGHAADRFPVYGQFCASCAAWTAPDTLYIQCCLLDELVGTVHFQFAFSGKSVTVFLRKTEETYLNEYQGFFNGAAV